MKVRFTKGFLNDCERLGIASVTGYSLKKLYWRWVPYNWRPGQIWYRLKCFCWHRYTTIKPKTLPYHTWCGKVHLILHCCFELLSRFMERELGIGTKDEHLGNINWDSDEAHKEALAEMRELYNWWKDVNRDPDTLLDDWTTWDEQQNQLRRLIEVRKYMWT